MKRRLALYFFGWPSHIGGADTKFAHVLLLLHRHYDITVVPNTRGHLEQTEWRDWLGGLGVKTALLEDLPHKLSGWAVSLCNGWFWTEGIAVEARRRGLKTAWSSEMMWHHAGERMAAQWGLMDKALYTSEVQRAALAPGYGNVPGVIVGNYIAPEMFPWRDRTRKRRFEQFVIGRLSRPDPGKFPRDFPESYQALRLKQPRYRVMAWSEQLCGTYDLQFTICESPANGGESRKSYIVNRKSESRFRGQWDLLGALAEPQVEFLHSLDLFVYDLREDCSEAWGRAVVEAMLTGAVPLVPSHPRHHLRHLVPHGVAGFQCAEKAEWRECAQRLQRDARLRRKMSRAAREFAVDELCNAAKHRAAWREVFEG